MTISVELQADLATSPSTVLSASTAVALPPSSLDSASDRIRVAIDGGIVTRRYDPTLEQP